MEFYSIFLYTLPHKWHGLGFKIIPAYTLYQSTVHNHYVDGVEVVVAVVVTLWAILTDDAST